MVRCVVLFSLSLVIGLSLAAAQPPASPALTIVNTLEGHKELVYTVTHTPDGSQLISGSFDRTVKLWDLKNAKEAKTFGGGSGHNDLVLTTAINPEGRVIASGAKDNSIKLWDMPVNGALRDFAGSNAAVTCEAITVDGSKLATGQADGVIRLWNTSNGKQVAELQTNKKMVTCMTISVNGQLMAVGDVTGQIFLFQLSDNKLVGQLTGHGTAVSGLAFHANNQLLYSSGMDGMLKGWNVPFGAAATPYKLDKATVVKAYRAVDGRVALACSDKTIHVVKADGTLEKKLPAAGAEIKAVALQGNTVIASLADGKVAWWDVAGGTLVHQIDVGPSTSISLRSDANEFAVGLADGKIKIGEVTKDKSKGADKVINKTITAGSPSIVQYHPTDANILALADGKKALKTWKIKENQVEHTLPLDAPGTQITWSKDGSRLAVCADKTIYLFQAKEGKPVTKLRHGSTVVHGGFGADTTRVITTTQEGDVHVFDVGNSIEILKMGDKKAIVSGVAGDPKKMLICSGTGTVVESNHLFKSIACPKPIRGGLWLMDGGNRVVVGGHDGIARIYNLNTNNVDKELKGHSGMIRAVTTLANSQVVFTSGEDKTIRCYSANDGKELKVLTLPAASSALAVQGNMLVAGCFDSSIVAMSVPYAPGQAITEAFGKTLLTFKQSGPITGVTLPSAQNTIYVCSDDKSVKSWKIAGDIPLRNLLGHGNLVDAVAFSPDGHTLASCSHDGTIRLWNPHDGKPMGEVKLNPQPLYCLAWRPDGKQLAIGSFDKSIRLINVAEKKVEREIKGYDEKSSPNGHSDAVYSVAYAGNDQLYSAGADGKIKRWNTQDGGMVKTFVDPAVKDKAQRDFINTIKLSKDGKKLVAVGNGGWITLWTTADGKLLHSQKLPVGLYGLSIHPDGGTLATGNMNGTIYVIKMP